MRARVAVAAALVALATLVLAPAASAHAILLRSEPADGAVLATPPRELRLWFSEGIAARLSGAELLDAEGRSIRRLRLQADPVRHRLAVLALPDLRTGVYSVAWRVFSEDDAHYRQGLVVFRVGAGASPATAGAARQESPLPLLEVVLRWLDLAALVALAGAVAVTGWVLVPPESAPGRQARDSVRRARRRVLAWGAIAAGLALVVGTGLLAVQVATLGAGAGGGGSTASAWELLNGTRWGALWLAREGLLVALGGVLLLACRAERSPPERSRSGPLHALAVPAAGLLVASLALVHTLAGHAGAGSSAAGAVAAGAVHLLAAGLWVGGLLALLIGWPRGGGHAGSASLARASLRRFGGLALLSAGLVAVTGLYYAGQEVASPDAALGTLYGRVLLGKLGLVLLTGAFGLVNAVLLRPRIAARLARMLGRPAGRRRPPPRRLRRIVLVEVCLGLLVLGGAGVLGAAVPARGPEFEPARGPFPAYLTQSVDDLLVTMSVRPNRPGPNLFEVLVASTRRPPLAETKQVTLRFTSAEDRRVVTSPPLRAAGSGRYRLGGDFLSAAGSWRIDAVIERSGLQDSVASFDWSLGAPAPAHPVVVSDARLEPLLTRAAIAGLLALMAGAAWLLLRRRQGRSEGSRVAVARAPADGRLREEAS